MSSLVRSLPLAVFVAMVAVPLAMAGIAVFAGLHARRRAALVESTPTSPIGAAEDGYRELEGRVEAIGGRTLTAPLTRAACCWYRAKVEKWVPRTDQPDTARWQTVRDVTSSAPFLVRDATGVCVVEPFGAEVTPTDRSEWYGRTQEPEDRNPERVPPTQSARGRVSISGGGRSKYRYTEERIYAGDPLLVLGAFDGGRPEPGVDDDDEIDADEAAGDDGEPRGGPPSDDAWDDSWLADQLVARAARITRASIGKGEGRQPFVFTTTSQAEHAELMTLGGSAALGVALVPLAIAAVLLLLRFA